MNEISVGKDMRVSIITQARVASTRLAAKVLKTIKGKSLLAYHIQRARWSDLPIIVATTVKEQDEPIVEECKILEVPFFRGDECDVLGRYYHCARENQIDTIIRITSDCPLIDGYLIREGYEEYKRLNADYLSNSIERTFPRGLDFEIFSFRALKLAYENAKELPEREHVTPYIWKNNPNLFEIKNFSSRLNKSEYRITVDTDKDFEVIKILIEDFGVDQKGYKEIIEILDSHPEIVKINQDIKQKDYGE
ncbi:MAG: glycosyltransferase family protein [bacterium]